MSRKAKKTFPISTKEEVWTPKTARELLAIGGANRRLSEMTVSRYANAMNDGRWTMNGETIKISRAGKLLDGQHRLHAVIESGKSVAMLTVRGLLPKTQASVDDGFKRNTAHVLDIAGEKHSTTLSFALSLLDRWEKKELHQVRSRSGHGPRRDECVAVLKLHPDIRLYVAHKLTFAFGKHLGSRGLFAFCWYVCSKNNADLADMFYEQLSLGVALGAEDPVYHLRERLLRSKLADDPRKKVDTLQKLMLIQSAWNATVQGRSIQRLQLPKENSENTTKIEFK